MTPRTVLIVDDNEDNREVLHDFCLTLGLDLEPILAEDGAEALEEVRRSPPDLILLDILMPVKDGIETLRELKEDEHLRRIPVVMISALGEEKTVIECIELGAEDHLVKPFNPAILRARIANALKRAAWERERIEQVEAAGDGVDTGIGSFPFPIAALVSQVEARAGTLAQVILLCRLLEVVYQFQVATAAGLMMRNGRNHGEVVEWLGPFRHGKPSLGTWVKIAQQKAGVDIVGDSAGLWRGLRRCLRPELLKRMAGAIDCRNHEIAHGCLQSETHLKEMEGSLRSLTDDLLADLDPLAGYEMVSLVAIEEITDRGSFRYSLRHHCGPSEVFPIQRRELDHVLQKPWCYLIREGEEPICLAPFLFCMDSSRSKRPEVFLSAGITLGPRGGRVRGSGVTTNNTETVPMPSGNTWDLLYAELQRYREEQRRE